MWKTGLLLETGCRIFYIHRCSKNWRIPESVHNPLLQYPEFHPDLIQRKIHRLLCLATACLLSKMFPFLCRYLTDLSFAYNARLLLPVSDLSSLVFPDTTVRFRQSWFFPDSTQVLPHNFVHVPDLQSESNPSHLFFCVLL